MSQGVNPPGAGPSGSSSGANAVQASAQAAPKISEPAREDDHSEDDDDDEVNDTADHGGAGGEDGGKKKKKKKKKSKPKGKAAATAETSTDLVNVVRSNMTATEQQNVSNDDIRKAFKAADIMKLLEQQLMLSNAAPVPQEHKFWKTQPVRQKVGEELQEGPIDVPKTPADVRQTPLPLPAGFEWSTVDIKDDAQIQEVHELLTDHYVEDDDAMFRFRYSKEFLLWSLTSPGYDPEWHIGVRVQKTGKLIAFISSIKVELRARSHTWDSGDVNFLCVHKKLRSKRLAPVLIKEVTRRVNMRNIWQAIYTGGIVIPTPFSTCRYYHRNLNPPKLVDIGFSPLPRGSTIARLVKQYNVGAQTLIPGFREMRAEDVPQVGDLLRRYLARFDVAQTFSSDEDVAHWFISGQGHDADGKRKEQVVWAYVVEDPETHKITDVVSFYSLPSTIMKHPKYDVLNAAYMFYYASDAIFSAGGSSDDQAKQKLDTRLNALMWDLMVIAQTNGFDVMNALTLMDNNMFLHEQKFGAGDGFLNYYLYNWHTAPVDGGINGTVARESSGVGVVML